MTPYYIHVRRYRRIQRGRIIPVRPHIRPRPHTRR